MDTEDFKILLEQNTLLIILFYDIYWFIFQVNVFSF